METNEALLIVDMLHDFIDPSGALYCGEAGSAIVPFIKEELSRYRAGKKPVIYICDRHRTNDAEFETFPRHCIAGEKGAAVYEELTPEPGDYIVYKRRYSSFFGTDLDLLLKELGVERIQIVGVCTNICVLYTAADARMRGLEVYVNPKCVASFNQDSHLWALKEMKDTLGVRVSEEK